MAAYSNEFPLNEGLEIQASQLEGWKKVLLPEVFEKVKEEITKGNGDALTGWALKRGLDIEDTIHLIIQGKL
jgi:hypothetical protein